MQKLDPWQLYYYLQIHLNTTYQFHDANLFCAFHHQADKLVQKQKTYIVVFSFSISSDSVVEPEGLDLFILTPTTF